MKKELEEDLDQTFQSLKTAFRFKRRDIETQGPADGGAVAVTPYFNYEASVSLDPDDPTSVVWRREITSIRDPDSIMTDAFDLPCQRVIHAVGPIWGGGGDHEEECLDSCYRSSVRLAAAEGFRTIAFPAISTGIYGYPIEDACRVAMTALTAVLVEVPEIEEVLDTTDHGSGSNPYYQPSKGGDAGGDAASPFNG